MADTVVKDPVIEYFEEVHADDAPPTEAEIAAKAAEDAEIAEADKAAEQKADEPESPIVEIEGKKFDPSKVDVTDTDKMGALSDLELKAVVEFHAQAPKPGEPPAKDTVLPDTDKDGKPVEKAPAPEPVKYAGKYDTPDALLKGVREIAGKFSYPQEVLDTIIAQATESKDYKSVEAFYKAMEKQLGSQAAPTAAPASPAPDTTPAQGTVVPDTVELERLHAGITQMTYTQLQAHPIVGELLKRGFAIPQSVQDFEAMTTADPYIAAKFERIFTDLYQANLAEAREYEKAKTAHESENARTLDADIAKIKELAAAQGLPLTDQDIVALKAEIAKTEWAYETKHGHKYLRPTMAQVVFNSTFLSGKMDAVRQAAELTGRRKAMADLKVMDKKIVKSIGTAPVSTVNRPNKQAKIDYSDPDVLAQLSDEELDKLARDGKL